MAEPKDSNKMYAQKKRKHTDSPIAEIRSEEVLSSQELQERGSVDFADNLQERELQNNNKEGEGRRRRRKKKEKNKEKEEVEKEQVDVAEGATRKEIEEDPSSSKVSKNFTVSMAVAGSIVENAQSMSLASRLAGQIARAAAIFRIDEIVVFDDGDEGSRIPKWSEDKPETSGTFLTRILKYMETPQYLRHALVPKHSSLQYAGGLPPLDVPHQARKHEWILYREGAVTAKPPPSGCGSFVNVGLYEDVLVQQKLPLGTRVTVNMGAARPEPGARTILDVVPRSEPRGKAGLYWGYTVRHASCLSTVFSESPFQGGYDYIIGTSEHGQKISATELVLPKFNEMKGCERTMYIPRTIYRHMMVVFGGVAGLEESKELDTTIKVGDVRHLFDIYLNTCPGQGSRTIRTEEAVLISLQYLQDPFMRALGVPFSNW